MKGRSSLVSFGAVLACAGLFGCGGGGGGGGGSSGLPQPPSTPISISAANANQVTDAALAPTVGGTDVVGASISSSDTPQSNPRVLLRAMQAVSAQAKKPSSSSGLTDQPENGACFVSGSVTVTVSGNNASITFNSCSDVAGQVLNGTVSATGIQETPTSFSATFNVDLTFTETGAQTLRLVGAFSISENCPAPGSCTAIFSGSSLGAAHGSEVWFISGFSITSVEGNGLITVTANYTVASSDLNGAVSVNTTSPILIMPGMDYPHNGVIQVTGAQNSRAVITINSNTPSAPNAVTVELDFAPGDGTFDLTNNYSWNQLESI